MEQYVGTKTYGFPITVSALIDDNAEVRGIRIVTDPRDPSGDRDEAYLLRNFLNSRFGRDGWKCEDLAADEGETPVAGVFVKQRCEKADRRRDPRACWSPVTCASPARANTIRIPARRRRTSSKATSASRWFARSSTYRHWAVLLPLPARGERVGVRGPIHKLRRAERPPHPDRCAIRPFPARGERYPYSGATMFEFRQSGSTDGSAADIREQPIPSRRLPRVSLRSTRATY